MSADDKRRGGAIMSADESFVLAGYRAAGAEGKRMLRAAAESAIVFRVREKERKPRKDGNIIYLAKRETAAATMQANREDDEARMGQRNVVCWPGRGRVQAVSPAALLQ